MKVVKSLLLMMITILVCTVSTLAYSDVNEDNKYYDAITFVTENNISNGVGNDRFAPDSNITVAQFCTMLMRAFDNDTFNSEKPCTYEIVRACSELGWISEEYVIYGISISNPITKGSAALSIISALDVNIYDNRLYGGEHLSDYYEAVRVARYNGIYSYEDSVYDSMTRAEAANLIYKFVTEGVQQEIPHIVQEFPIINNENVDPNEFYMNIMKCPKVIRDRFISDGWKFLIDEKPINEFARQKGHSYGYYVGLTSYDDKLIAVSSPYSVLHEFGHYLQFSINRYSEIYNLYRLEGINNDEIREYARISSEEYFADYFDYFVANPYLNIEEVRELTPKTYEFFEELELNGWFK